MKKLLLLLVIISAFAACKNDAPQSPAQDVVAAHVDTTVNPADDFFMFANGGWIKNNPIPESGGGSNWLIVMIRQLLPVYIFLF